jgi:hypothetical protein
MGAIMKSKTLKPWQFYSGSLHPKATKLAAREQELRRLPLGTLAIIEGSIRRDERSRQVVDAACSACGRTFAIEAGNILAGRTRSCRCQRNRKYHDPRAEMLALRYDSMVQRCERDTHKQSHDYKGRGIKVLFASREAFVRWALAKWPETNFKGLEFDRIDNDGHYAPDNLRLVTSRENKLNTRQDIVLLSVGGQVIPWADWDSPYTPRMTQRLAAAGLTAEQILDRAREAVATKAKNWRSIAKKLDLLAPPTPGPTLTYL